MKAVSSEHKELKFSERILYRALTLRERRHTSDTSAVNYQDEQLTKAAKRLEQWKNQLVFRDSELFAERLAMDALTEQELLMLLAEPVESLQKRFMEQTKPEWISELQYLWETDPASYEEALPSG